MYAHVGIHEDPSDVSFLKTVIIKTPFEKQMKQQFL